MGDPVVAVGKCLLTVAVVGLVFLVARVMAVRPDVTDYPGGLDRRA